MATADTKRWRKARRTIPRDLSPLPESIPTPYKRLRAPDERAANCQDMRNRQDNKAAAEGRVITPCARTPYKMCTGVVAACAAAARDVHGSSSRVRSRRT